ncbi:hypothetical protein FOA52_004135 [Chlamydomonas sp. UWO 241]|nr:hypothetical protein FOA52_004135 [Chlamydomonas sp. UWO 241]
MYIVLDVETTGLMRRGPTGKYPLHGDLAAYDGARVVSISWQVLDASLATVDAQHFIVRPSGFEAMPEAARRVHGISTADVTERGVGFDKVACKLRRRLERHGCTQFVAHNARFDANVVLSELHRLGDAETYRAVTALDRRCTMREGRCFLEQAKNPRLGELFKALFGTEMENAHRSDADVEACRRCFAEMEARKKTADASVCTLSSE